MPLTVKIQQLDSSMAIIDQNLVQADDAVDAAVAAAQAVADNAEHIVTAPESAALVITIQRIAG